MSTEQNDQQTSFPKIGNPALRALNTAGYTHLEQLTEVSAAELLRLHGMGPKGIRILRAALEERGLSFADEKRKL